MPPLLFWTIYLLIRALGSVDARAVNTNSPSHPTSAISSSIVPDLPNATASQRCGDIDNCRTLDEIVVSCLVTILACVWFAVHRNIPAPSRKPKPMVRPYEFRDVFVKTAQRAWYLVLAQKEPAIVFVVAVLAPEYVLAWALKQAFKAWKLTGKLKKARAKAIEEKNQKGSTVSDLEKGTGEIAGAEGNLSSGGPAPAHDGSAEVLQPERVEQTDQRWGMSHAFFTVMGGFQLCHGNRPPRPLSPKEVVELVAQGHLVPPTAEEISDKSKGDAFSKGVAIGQTLWFVIQCVARGAENLPVTKLEVMTLAYTVMTVAMYIVWWHKPLNVRCAVRVSVENVPDGGADFPYRSIWDRIAAYLVGLQDHFADLSQCTHVPTFWAGNAGMSDAFTADVIALSVAMAFGAVHCIAWYSEFQSDLELQPWRYSSIAIIAVPVALVVLFFAVVLTGNSDEMIISILSIPVGIIYITARAILIVLSFTSLKGLPVGAYQTVHWSTLIPHI